MKQLLIDIRTKLLSISDGVYTSALTKNITAVTGLDDATFTGTYTGRLLTKTITVTISIADTIDSFSATDGTWSLTDIPITGAAQYLIDGISITFAAITGHTVGNSWRIVFTSLPALKFVQVWNNQTALNEEGELYDYAKPACFIELISPNQIQQLGNGGQLYDELICRLHIVHDFYNATDGLGDLEQDLTIFDLKRIIWKTFQKFEPTGAVMFVRTAEEQQFNHRNIYEYTQDYKTNYVDNDNIEPIGFIEKDPPTDYRGRSTQEITYSIPPYLK